MYCIAKSRMETRLMSPGTHFRVLEPDTSRYRTIALQSLSLGEVNLFDHFKRFKRELKGQHVIATHLIKKAEFSSKTAHTEDQLVIETRFRVGAPAAV